MILLPAFLLAVTAADFGPQALSEFRQLSANVSGPLQPHPSGTLSSWAAVSPIIQAGHPSPDPASGILADSPDLRIDPNTTTSPFAGVGSIFADNDPSDPIGALGTGTAIDK